MNLKVKIFNLLLLIIFVWTGLTKAGFGADRVTFSTQDNPKANGLNFSVSYPADFEFVDKLDSASQIFVAYTNEPEFPTVLSLLVRPAPDTFPPFNFKVFKDRDVDRWVNESFVAPGVNPEILSKSKITHQDLDGIKAAALVDQVLLGENQPSIEELFFVIYEKHTITLSCSVFNAQQNPNILKHFYGRGGFEACNDFFSSLSFQ
jgi:hypothetical protein